jgi:SAM-dependent methyltransferase
MVQAPERPAIDVDAARRAYWQEWADADPQTPEEIHRFYQTSKAQAADLAAWHTHEGRQVWTPLVVHVARELGAKAVVDVGCGIGRELAALEEALPDIALCGVEPNREILGTLVYRFPNDPMFADVRHAPIEEADLLLCLDMLEHVPDPETFLGSWASRARLGAVLVESTATWDTNTPMHLPSNYGWHPGRCLQSLGYVLVDDRDRLRVWQRVATTGGTVASAILVAYRAVSMPTMRSLLKLQERGWRIGHRWSDGLISRARSIAVSRWWAETADDVFLMIDDDIVFQPADAERLVALCRDGHDIIAAAYPVRDGGHLAISGLKGSVAFGPDEPPLEQRFVSTGFMAVHRRVVDALMPTLPWCHESQPWCFKPLFLPFVIDDPAAGGHNYLSEDWAFVQRARDLGFRAWLDPAIILGHLAQIELNVRNMADIHAAIGANHRSKEVEP